MVTERRIIDPDAPDAQVIEHAAAILRRGGLVAFPTETVYGLGACLFDESAVERIYQAKGRPLTNPCIAHAGDVGMAQTLVKGWDERAARLASAFWPGPLTLVLPRTGEVPSVATAGQATVGVRVPDHPVALALIQAAGPIAAPSANRATGVSPTRASHVLKDLDGRIDLVLDAGPTRVGIESTVIDLTARPVRLLRPGAITIQQMENVLQESMVAGDVLQEADSVARSPGRQAVHYAPRAELRLVNAGAIDPLLTGPPASATACALLILGEEPPADLRGFARVRAFGTAVEAASGLYETLHEWDDSGIGLILVAGPPVDDEWRAVGDRIWRASRRWAHSGLGPGDVSA